jgi:Chromate resistance exported protein
MRWATRRHCHVDRAACAWLIRRFLDPEADFVFVDDPDEVPADATPFDMRGVETPSSPPCGSEPDPAFVPQTPTVGRARARSDRSRPRLRAGEVDAVRPAGVVESLTDRVALLVVDDRDPGAGSLKRREGEVTVR